MLRSTTGDDVADLFAGYAASFDVPPVCLAEVERRTVKLRRGGRRANGIWASSVCAALAIVVSCAVVPQVATAALSTGAVARAVFGGLLTRGHEPHVYTTVPVSQAPPPLRLPQLVPRASLLQVTSTVGPDGSASWTGTYRVNGTPRLLVVIEQRPGRATGVPAGDEQNVAALVAGMPTTVQTGAFDYRTMLSVRGISVTGLSEGSDAGLLDAALVALK